MPADLVPHDAIPQLANHVTPDMLEILRYIQRADFIRNSEQLDRATLENLKRLTELGLVDPAYQEDSNCPVYIWMANGNGSRVLAYKTGIRGGPHYEVSASDLAAWLEEQGPDRWWNVDGDPLLTGRMTFPCPARKLSAELRRMSRPLLVQAKKNDKAANGQVVSKQKIEAVVDHIGNNLQFVREDAKPPWSEDRVLYLCWKGSNDEWLLAEDGETTALMEAEDERRAGEATRAEKK